jgi:hypothetical protein
MSDCNAFSKKMSFHLVAVEISDSIYKGGTMLQAGRSRVRVPMMWIFFLNWPSPSGRTGPGVDSASNRNEYQESLKIKKPGSKVRPARRADNLATIY